MRGAEPAFAAFRAAREAELVEPYGWLTLRGFHWLPTAPSPLPGLPGRWWADADQHSAHLEAGVEAGLDWDGVPLTGVTSLTVAEYGRVPWVDQGDLRVELLRRGGRLAVRLRAATSPEREAFRGVPLFAYDAAWCVTGRYTAYAAERAVEVETIRPDLRQVLHPFGEVAVELGGRTHRLAVTEGKYGWGVEFHDLTNGVETERWRQLHVEPPVAGSDEVVLDFNRALNMWFAFTDFATCPAPIPGNAVDVAVRAGELRWR